MSKKQKLNLSTEEIKERQQELYELGVLEKFTDFKLSEAYLNEFLKKYSDLSGQYSYVQGSILLPLFKRIREKNPDISEDEVVEKAEKLFPILKAMLIGAKVFKLIKKVSKMSDKEVERELKNDWKKDENDLWEEGSFAETLDSETLKKRMKTFHKSHDEDMSFNCRKCGKKISAHNKDWHAGLCDDCFNKEFHG